MRPAAVLYATSRFVMMIVMGLVMTLIAPSTAPAGMGTQTSRVRKTTSTPTAGQIQKKSLGFTPSLSAPSQSQDRLVNLPKICQSCTGDMAFAGDPTDSSRLYLLIEDQLRRSPDGGKSWTPPTQLDEDFDDEKNAAARVRPGGMDGQLVVFDDHSFAVSAMTTLEDPLGRSPKFGGVLYLGLPNGRIDSRIFFQGIPERDTQPSQFAFLDRPRLAAHSRPRQPAIFYIGASGVWFEDSRTIDTALYVLPDAFTPQKEVPVMKVPLHVPGDPDAISLIESVAVDTEGKLYAAVLTGQPKLGATVKTTVVRFDAPNVSEAFVPLDGPPKIQTHQLLFPRIPSQNPKNWLVNTGPQLLVDTNSTSRYRGRLYRVWAQEEKPTDDGSFGSNYDIYVSFLDPQRTTWSPAVRVNKDLTGDQVQPSAQLDLDVKDGTLALHVVWLSRNNPESALFDVYYARSEDGAATFPENLRITDKSLPIPAAPLGDPFEMLAAYTKFAYIVSPCGTGAADRCLTKVERGQAPKHLTLDIIPPQEVFEGDELKIILQGRDLDHHPIIYTFTSQPPTIPQKALDQTTGVFVWKPGFEEVAPGASPKEYKVKVAATDQPPSGAPVSDSTEFTITVKNVNQKLSFVDPTPKDKVTGQEGTAISFTVLAKDPDKSPVTYSISQSDLPARQWPNEPHKEARLDPKTGVFTWTPAFTTVTEGEKTFKVTIRATKDLEPSSKDERTIAIVVKHVSRPPSIVLTPNTTTYPKKAGETVRFAVSVPQEEAPVQFSLFPTETERPKGVVWDPVAGTFVWPLEESDVRERPYEFTIFAIDPSGGSSSLGVSNSISQITVSVNVGTANIPPTVSFVAPDPSKRITDPSKVEVKVKAVDPDGKITKVELFRGSQSLGQGTLVDPANSIYSFSVSLPGGGPYNLTAKATDDHLPQGATAEASIQLSANLPPSVRLIQPPPRSGATFTAPVLGLLLIAEASDADGSIKEVAFFKKGSDVPIAKATKDPSSDRWSGSWQDVPVGDHEVFVVATDHEGASTASPAAAVKVNPAPDNYPPSVEWVSPADGAPFVAPAKQIELKARASDRDGSIDKVEFLNNSNSKVIGTVDKPSSAIVSFVWENVPAGKYTVTARATDNKGANTTSSKPVTIEVKNPVINQVPNKAPVITTLTPTSSTIALSLLLREATVKMEASVEDNKLPNPPATLTYSWSWKKTSGPPEGNVVFNPENAPKTEAKFTGIGVYELELTVSDWALSESKKVTVTVTEPAPTGYSLSLPEVTTQPGKKIPTITAGKTIKVHWEIPPTPPEPGVFNGLLIGLYPETEKNILTSPTSELLLPAKNQYQGDVLLTVWQATAAGRYELRFLRGTGFKEVMFTLLVDVVKGTSPAEPPPPPVGSTSPSSQITPADQQRLLASRCRRQTVLGPGGSIQKRTVCQ